METTGRGWAGARGRSSHGRRSGRRPRGGVLARVALAAALAPALPGLVLGAQEPLVPAEGLHLRINLPAYRLEVFRDGERVRSYPAAIGLPAHPTPQGMFELGSVTWNPWWSPPASAWARGSSRTPPGPGNPMGRAKVEFDGLFYVHGSRESLGRAASHGCIRVSNEDALDLARLLAEAAGELSSGEIAALERNAGRTRTVRLPEGLAKIEIVYRLTEERGGEVLAYEDVYGRGLSARDRYRLDRRGASGGR